MNRRQHQRDPRRSGRGRRDRRRRGTQRTQGQPQPNPDFLAALEAQRETHRQRAQAETVQHNQRGSSPPNETTPLSVALSDRTCKSALGGGSQNLRGRLPQNLHMKPSSRRGHRDHCPTPLAVHQTHNSGDTTQVRGGKQPVRGARQPTRGARQSTQAHSARQPALRGFRWDPTTKKYYKALRPDEANQLQVSVMEKLSIKHTKKRRRTRTAPDQVARTCRLSIYKMVQQREVLGPRLSLRKRVDQWDPRSRSSTSSCERGYRLWAVQSMQRSEARRVFVSAQAVHSMYLNTNLAMSPEGSCGTRTLHVVGPGKCKLLVSFVWHYNQATFSRQEQMLTCNYPVSALRWWSQSHFFAANGNTVNCWDTRSVSNNVWTAVLPESHTGNRPIQSIEISDRHALLAVGVNRGGLFKLNPDGISWTPAPSPCFRDCATTSQLFLCDRYELLTGFNNGIVRSYDHRTHPNTCSTLIPKRYKSSIQKLACLPDENHLLVAYSNSALLPRSTSALQVFDRRRMDKPVRLLRGHISNHKIYNNFHVDEKHSLLFAGGSDGTLRAWDLGLHSNADVLFEKPLYDCSTAITSVAIWENSQGDKAVNAWTIGNDQKCLHFTTSA